jgi:type IV fimbrial biogenesis protein FimT
MRHFTSGFTLIELMIAMAVLALIIAIGVPSFEAQIRNNRSAAQAENLVIALNFARSEAVKRARRVSVCASTNGTSCNAADWKDGWIVFLDGAATDNANPPVIAIAATDVLKVWDGAGVNSTITEANSKTFIRFTSTGTLGRVDNSQVTITSKVAKCTGQAGREIRVGLSGLVSFRRISCE